MTEHRNEKGELHRVDGPAIVYTDGSCEWWVDGKFIKSEQSGERKQRERKMTAKNGFIVGGPKQIDGQWYESFPGVSLPIPAYQIAACIDLVSDEAYRYTFVIVDGKEIGFWVPEETSDTELFKRLIASYSKLVAAEKATVATWELSKYTTEALIQELQRRKISLRELDITKSELEKARKQFMQEREHWLALRDDNTRLIRIVDELSKALVKVGNEKDRN